MRKVTNSELVTTWLDLVDTWKASRLYWLQDLQRYGLNEFNLRGIIEATEMLEKAKQCAAATVVYA